MSNLDTNHVINLDLVKDRSNSVIKFGLADVETSDFYLGLYNNGTRIFDENYIVTLYIVKPNGTFRNIKLKPKEGLKKYYCNLPDTLKNIPGEYLCQAIIFDNLANEKKVSKSKFKYSVDLDLASEIAGIIGEEEQESILTNILNRLLTLENPVEPYATQKHVNECVSTLTEEIDTIKVKDVEQDGRLVNIESKNTEQDEKLNTVETKNNEQDNRLDIIEAKDIEQDNRIVNIESKNTEQDEKLNTIESKDIEQDERLNSLENKVDGIDEKIVDTIEPTLVNHGNRVDTLENKDLVHESRMTDIESKNVEQDNRLTSVEGINTTQDNRLDALEVKDIAHESRMVNIETKNTEQDNRLNSLESKDLIHESRMTDIESKNIEQDGRLDVVENKNQQQDGRLDVAESKNTQQDNRLDTIEGIDVAQNSRLDAIEIKNQQQDDRLLDVEKVNKRQENDLKCLFAVSKNHMIDATEEGNSVYLQNSTDGYVTIDNIQGNTLVNCNKEPDKEIILNGNINTQGYSDVTLTEGVDGGLVDVALEGNTMVNVCDQKDPVAITKSYTVETGNHVALQGEYDGKCRPVVTGNTLVNITGLSNCHNAEKYTPYDLSTTNYHRIAIYPASQGDIIYFKINITINDIALPADVSNVARLITYRDIGGFAIVVSDFKDYSAGTYTFEATRIIDKNCTLNKCCIQIERNSSLWTNDCRFNFTINDYVCYNLTQIFGAGNEPTIGNIDLPYIEGLQSSFEDKVVTQEMIDNGEELAKNLGKYKVDYVISQEDGTVGQTKTFYLNSPLLEGDTIEQQRNNVVHVHRSELRAYQTGDELTLPTDMTNTLVSKATPQYEVISQNDTILCDSYVNGHLDVDSVVPIERVNFNNISLPLKYQYPSTEYLMQFNSDNEGKICILYSSGANLSNIPIIKGLNKLRFSTNAEPYPLVIVDGIGFNASNIVVTQATDQDFGYFEGMKSVGECEDLEVVSSNSDGTLSNTQTLTHEPLRAVGDIKDKYVLIDGKWYIERNCGVRAYQEGNIDNYITDKINTVYPLSTPTYEPIDYNPFTVYSDTTHISNNSTIPCNMIIKNTGYNCLLKPSTTYTVSSNLGLNTVTTPSTLTEDCLRFYDTDTSTITTMRDVLVLEGDWTSKADLIPSNFNGIKSAFEQEYDAEKGKYKVNVKVANEDKTKENNITFYLNEPLRGIGDVKDRVYVKDDKVVVERNCGVRAYMDGDFGTYLTDKGNTVYPLASPTYEEVEYNDTKLFIESFKNSTLFYNSNIPVTSKLYYSYSVPIVDTVAQTANVTDQQDSMIIDLATQCAILEMMTL